MLTVLRAGPLCTVQDLGRAGFRSLGVSVGGALDRFALQAANLLVGNPRGAAGLEIAICPARFAFERDGWIALTGAAAVGELNGRPLRPWWRYAVRAGEILKLAAPTAGMTTYLAVGGGIDVPVVLGSRGTDLSAGFGGFEGRALRDGDRLPLGQADCPPNPGATPVGVFAPEWRPDVRVLPGPQYDEFDAGALDAFWKQPWRMTPNGNRMGHPLAGPELRRARGGELPSHGVLPGVIQVPPSGWPIVLLADAQTTGGYPVIGVVIAADVWKLAQLRPGESLHMVRSNESDACTALADEQARLRRIERTLAWQ